MITLQINDSGSWRNLLKFEVQRREEILQAAAKFAGVLGGTTKWALLHADGRREWLPDLGASASHWHPITTADPAPLHDVMVSVFCQGDEAPEVLMAYRKKASSDVFYLSGTPDQVVRGAYAYSQVIEPAQRVTA